MRASPKWQKEKVGRLGEDVISDLLELVKSHDPDLILCPHADTWIPIIVRKARRYGLEPTISRTGWFKQMASKSYWSYGKVNHKDGAIFRRAGC